MGSTFHPGEVALHRRMGVAQRLDEIGDKVIHDHMLEPHRAFFAQLPTLLIGSVDAAGRPWASALIGQPVFLRATDARHLRIDTLPSSDDPFAAHLAIGAPVGVLGLEPATRRRNRMNGRVAAVSSGGFEVEVDQCFGNCAQYIQARTPQQVAIGPTSARHLGAQLDAPARSWRAPTRCSSPALLLHRRSRRAMAASTFRTVTASRASCASKTSMARLC